jgi:hypothetical protein
MRNKSRRIDRENATVAAMIRMYCRDTHGSKELCLECSSLLDYARMRLEKCLFGEGKTTCTICPVHCYKPDMRERIRVVMRYAGPRMMYRHPLMAILHLIDGRRKAPVARVAEG